MEADRRPEVYAIRRGESGWTVNRRNLLRAAAAAAAIAPGKAKADSCIDGAYAHFTQTTALAVSPDGRMLVSGGWEGRVNFWRLPDGALLKAFQAHQKTTSPVMDVAISPDARLLVTGGGGEEAIKLWSLPGAGLLKTLEGHTKGISGLLFSADGRTLTSSSWDRQVKQWSMPDGALVRTIATDHRDEVDAIAVSPDGRLLATGSYDTTIRLWSLPDGTQLAILRGHTEGVQRLQMSPDGRLLISFGRDDCVRIWSLPDGALLKTVDSPRSWWYALAMSPDGEFVAYGGLGLKGDVTLLGLPEGTALNTFDTGVRAHSMAISPDGRLLICGGDDGSIRLNSLPDGKLIATCFIDLATSSTSVSGSQYTQDGVTYTVPCGTPLPAGAVCNCNCVPGSCSCVSQGGGGGGCNPVTYWYPN